MTPLAHGSAKMIDSRPARPLAEEAPLRRAPRPAPRLIPAAMLIAMLSGGCEAQPNAAVHAGAQSAGLDPADTWEAQYMQGVKVGFVHTVRRPCDARDGRQLVEVDSRTVLNIARGGQDNQQEMRVVSVETPDGRLVSFHSEASLGPSPTVVDGKVQGDALCLEERHDGGAASRKIPWPPDALGFSGLDRCLRDHPMRPGDHRQFQAIVPLLNQLATISLQAVDYENTRLLSDERTLLKIECSTRAADGTTLKEHLWVTPEGEALKTAMVAADQASYRCTRAEAMSPAAGKVDLFRDMLVRPKQPLRLAAGARRARYVVRLRDGNPAQRFPQCAYQAVEPIDSATARISVWQAGPLSPPERPDLAAEPAPSPEYLAANALLEIHDPAVKSLADGVQIGSAERAVTLERAVFQAIAKKNFSQAFASAAEAARSRAGDCTEHAVLLAAVARASGIPSRVAVGLIYLEPPGGFAFHMWTEVYTGGHWLPLDATLGRGGIGVTHLKLADSSLANDTALSVFLPVAEVLGQLDIEPAGE